MLIAEDTLTNPQIQAGTPPVYVPPADPPPQQSLVGYWYFDRKIRPLFNDTCDGIETKAQEFNTFLQFHIRTLEDEGEYVPGGGGGDDNPALPEKLKARTQAGMQRDLPSRIDKFPTGTFIRGTGALMSTPYHGTDRRFFRNLVKDHPENVNEETAVYHWVLDDEDDRKYIRPREDGSISVTPPSRRSDMIRSITLPVVSDETSRIPNYSTRFKNDQVNAFTLVLGVQQGPEYESTPATHARPIPWKVTVKFGEVELALEEGRPEAKISFNGRTETITINPGASSRTRTDAGYRSYELTFIPVWNGIVFADSSPSSSNWQEKATYIKKTLDKTMFTEYQEQFHQKTSSTTPSIPRFGDSGELLPTPDPVGEPSGSVAPDAWSEPDTDDTPEHKGCFLPTTGQVMVDFGVSLTVEFERCGGTLRFIPVFFSKCIRSYLFKRGEHVPESQADNECPAWPIVPDLYPVPVYNYQGIDTTSNRPFMWIQEQSDPAHILAYETERTTDGYRRPVEIWGYVIALAKPVEEGAAANQEDYTYEGGDFESGTGSPGETTDSSVDAMAPLNDVAADEEGNIQALQFRRGEGFLTNADLPIARIRRLSLTRSLDGTNGTIEWDRYDPALGLFARPLQRVGALRLYVSGGVNTRPGVIYTGIAMGNAETDSHDSNSVTIPLYGRECKMTDSEGGLRIINAPFFDANDHRDVIRWMADYAGVPFVSFAGAYRLPAGSIMSPVVDIKTGTPVWDGIQEICKLGSTITFFDRLGILTQRGVGTTSNVNWLYPVHKIENYDDKPDLSSMRDTVVVAALVGEGEIDPMQVMSPDPKNMNPDVQPMMIARQFATVPRFPWSKMMFYAVQGIITRGQLRKAAIEITKGVTRPRATASITIPGNAQVELLDRFNGAWAIVSITQNIDMQAKTWSTQLSLELIMGAVPEDNEGAGVPGEAGEPDAEPGPAPTPPSGSLSPIGTQYDSEGGIDGDVETDPDDSPGTIP